MKNLQQNLLMILALALCVLCAWQWYVQTLLHNEGEALQRTIQKQAADIQEYTNSIKNMDSEISGLSTRMDEMKQSALSNEQTALEQKREILRLHSSGDALSNQVVQYKDAAIKLDARLREAADGVEKQNEAIKLLITNRDDAFKKYNDAMKDRNALAEKYNELVERFNKLQAARSTNQ
jgi:uncharacterized coiled-coil DUF342 family protein